MTEQFLSDGEAMARLRDGITNETQRRQDVTGAVVGRLAILEPGEVIQGRPLYDELKDNFGYRRSEIQMALMGLTSAGEVSHRSFGDYKLDDARL